LFLFSFKELFTIFISHEIVCLLISSVQSGKPFVDFDNIKNLFFLFFHP